MNLSIKYFGDLRFLVIAFIMLSNSFLKAQDLSAEKLVKLSLEELMQIELTTAGKKWEKISEVPASVVVITRNEIEKYGYQSTEEILKNIPGLFLIDDYIWTGTKNFGVRGFFSTGAFNDVIVLINGVNQKTESLYDSFPTEKIAVPVEAIERIEFIRGPMSVIYGSGAFFGAINIITAESENTKDSYHISGSIGSYNLYRIYGGLQNSIGDLKYSLNAELFNDDGIDVPFNKLMSNPEIANLPAEQGGWNLNATSTKGLLKTRRKYIDFSGSYKDLQFYAGMVHSKKDAVEGMFGAGGRNSVTYSSTYLSFEHKMKFTEELRYRSKVGYFIENHWVDNEFFYEYSYTNNLARLGAFEGELNLFFNPTEALQSTFGLFVRHVDDYYVLADYPYSQFPDVEISIPSITNYALFAQIDYRVTKELKFTAGLRLEKPEPYDVTVSVPNENTYGVLPGRPTILQYAYKPANSIEFIPRIAAVYSFNEKNILKLLYGEAIKQPSAGANLDLIFSPAPSLSASQIKTLELNYLSIFSNTLTGSFSLFYNSLDNLISRLNVIDPESGLTIISSNSGKMITKGIEVGLKIYLWEKLEADINCTYQKSENRKKGFEDIELPYSPDFLGYFKLNYKPVDNFQMSVVMRFVDEMYSEWNQENIDENNLPILQQGQIYDGRIGKKAGSYFATDTNIKINRFPTKDTYINFHVSNIFDTEVYYPTTTSNPQFDLGTMGAGRVISLSLGYKF